MERKDLLNYFKIFKEKYNGDYSILYGFIKDKLDQYNYECYELPFPDNFLFFEEDYISIYDDIMKRNLNEKKIIDIGCQLGIQSEILKLDFDYVGIDCCNTKFFNHNDPKCKFIVGKYPITLDYTNAIVISNMSLGYFSKNEEEDFKKFAEELSKCKYLYIRTTSKFRKVLSEYFDEEWLEDSKANENMSLEISNNLYFLTNKKLKNVFN